MARSVTNCAGLPGRSFDKSCTSWKDSVHLTRADFLRFQHPCRLSLFSMRQIDVFHVEDLHRRLNVRVSDRRRMPPNSITDSLLAPYAGRGREALLPVLWDVQTAAGYVSAEAVHAISHCLRVPEADIYGVIGFYSLFHAEATGERIVRVCTDPVCGLRGGDALLGALHVASDVTIEHSPCLGLCEHAPGGAGQPARRRRAQPRTGKGRRAVA